MSKEEAILDGIKVEYDKNYPCRGGCGGYVYYIPCQICGRILKRNVYSRTLNYSCNYCKKTIKKKAKIQKELLEVETPKERQFNKAVSNILNQVKNPVEYERAIKLAKTRCELYGSIPETMVCIELLKLGYNVIPQQKINKYRVDFAIPDNKLIIEVDGSIYHKDVYKGDREAIIQLSLGLDWKIIHIPAEKIAKNITKVKNIINVFNK